VSALDTSGRRLLLLGSIPIEPEVVAHADAGTPIVKAKPNSETAKAFGHIVRTLLGPEQHDADEDLVAQAHL